MHSKLLAITLCSLAGALGACGEDAPGHDPAEVNCDLEDRDDTYVAGLEHTGEAGITVALVDATPAPPAKDLNTWHLQVMDDTRAGLSGVTVTATPFMPDHGHGTTPAIATAAETTETGVYEIGDINLRMPGLWEVYVEVVDGIDIDDRVTFRFCIEG